MLARVDVDPLVRDQQRIEGRRQRFQERTKRILDPRLRTLGIDKDSLDMQIAEKEERQRQERDYNASVAAQVNQHAAMITSLENQRVAEARYVVTISLS